jgi:hypothetical protein
MSTRDDHAHPLVSPAQNGTVPALLAFCAASALVIKSGYRRTVLPLFGTA